MLYATLKLLRFCICVIDFIFTLSVTFICSFLPLQINKFFMHRLFRLMCSSFIHAIGGIVHIHQKNNSALPKHFILVSNHPSGYDILLLNSLFKVYPLAQKGVMKWFFFGRIARAIGTVFVERGDKTSRGTAKKACFDNLVSGKSILIYPEGGCYGKELGEFKYGAFDLSLNTGIPIIPVYLNYEAENCFEWGDVSLPHHLFNMFKAKNKHVHCYISDAISPYNFADAKSYKDYVHSLYEKWQDLYRHPRCHRVTTPILNDMDIFATEQVHTH